MPLGVTMDEMRARLQEAFDDLASPRSSSRLQLKALQSIEKCLAQALFVTLNDSEEKDCFVALQYTFECNVPAHLLSWIIKMTAKLESVTNRGMMDADQTAEAEDLASKLALALSLVQGIVLNHESSKIYLGRKPALETLLDLVLVSRHIPAPKDPPSADCDHAKTLPVAVSPHLTSIVLDTLLCILVDAPLALRTFEAANGVQAIVKILKRAGTPREVRMKCLEFLYFYLLDETPTSSPDKSLVADLMTTTNHPTPPPTAPATPVRPLKPYLSNGHGAKLPSSRYGSSTYAFSSVSTSTSTSISTSGSAASLGLGTASATNSLSISGSSTSSSRSTSSSSAKSFCSTSSNASSSTAASSFSMLGSATRAGSPVKESTSSTTTTSTSAHHRSPAKRVSTPSNHHQRTPISTPASTPASPPGSGGAFASAARYPQLRSMMMLRKDVEYVPMSPRKGTGVGAGTSTRDGHNPGQSPGQRQERATEKERGLRTHQKSTSMSTTTTLVAQGSGGMKHSRSRSQVTSLGSMDEDSDIISPSKSSASDRYTSPVKMRTVVGADTDTEGGGKRKTKTTEEKKELLGTMLGNVDALVEGVRKAGIWGLPG